MSGTRREGSGSPDDFFERARELKRKLMWVRERVDEVLRGEVAGDQLLELVTLWTLDKTIQDLDELVEALRASHSSRQVDGKSWTTVVTLIRRALEALAS